MQFLKYGDYYYMAVGESHVKQVKLYQFVFGINICEKWRSEHNVLGVTEITEEEFNAAEKLCRKRMFDARQLFNQPKTLAV